MLHLMIFLTISNVSNADQVVQLNQNDKAPFAGLLFDQEKANNVKIGLIERDLYKEIMASQSRSIDLLKENEVYSENKVKMLLDQNDKLSQSLRSSQSMTTWERIGFFALGVLATVGAAYAVRSATR